MALTNKQKSTIDMLLQYGYPAKAVGVRKAWENGKHANIYVHQGNLTTNEVKRLCQFIIDGNDEIGTIQRWK